MKSTRKPLLPLLGLLTCLASLLLALLPDAPRDRRIGSRDGSPAGGEVESASSADPAAPEVGGADNVKRLRVHSRASLRRQVPAAGGGEEGSPGDGLDLVLELRALVELRAYRPDLVGLRLLEGEISVVASGRPPMMHRVDGAATDEALIVAGGDPWIRRVRFPAGMRAEARECLRRILLGLQHGTGPGTVEWQSEELDSTGAYQAIYRRLSPEGAFPAVLLRGKTGYSKVRSGGQLRAGGGAEVRGETRFTLDPLPIDVDSTERASVEIPETGERFESESTYRARLEASFRDPGLGAPPHLDAVDSDLCDPAPPEPVREGRRICERMLQVLEARARSGESADATPVEEVQALADLFRRSPEAARAAVGLCGSDRVARTVAGALALAGTPESQEALASILEDGARDLGVRLTAMACTVRLAEPTPALEEALRRVRDRDPDLGNSARLALATMGDLLRDREPERHSRIEREVLDDLDRAEGVAELTTALESLGNLGPREIPQRALRALEDEDERVRSAAVRALRRTPAESAARHLRELAEADAEASIRGIALEILDWRSRNGFEPRPADLLRRMAERDADPALRERAAGMLSEEAGS